MKWVRRGRDYFSADGRFEMGYFDEARHWAIARVGRLEWGEELMTCRNRKQLMACFEIITGASE